MRSSPKEVIVETHVDHSEINRLKSHISNLQRENSRLSHLHLPTKTEVLYEKVIDMEEVKKLESIIAEKDTKISELLFHHESLDGKVSALNEMLMKSH